MLNNSPELIYSGIPGLELMVVDNERLVRETISNSLKALGHRPLLFEKPENAIEAFVQEVDGVIASYDMPSMDGISMVRELRKRTQYLGVILVLPRTDYLQNLNPGDVQTILPKPFTLLELTRALSDPEFQRMVVQRRELRSV